jgi:hypothetical protein
MKEEEEEEFSPCIVNDYNVLVPTNAHIIRTNYTFHLVWLQHVSAGRHLQVAHNHIA